MKFLSKVWQWWRVRFVRKPMPPSPDPPEALPSPLPPEPSAAVNLSFADEEGAGSPVAPPPPADAGVAQVVEERRAVDAEGGGSNPPPGAKRTPKATLKLIAAGHEHCPGCGHHFDPRIRERMKYRKMVKLRRGVADSINEVLGKLATLDLKGASKYGAFEEARVLENLMGCDFYFLDPFFDQVEDDDNPLTPGSRFMTMAPHREINDDLAAISWPIDTAVAVRKDDHWMLERLKTVTPAEARGRCQFFPPRMAQHFYVNMYDNGTWFASDSFVGLMNGRWMMLNGNLKSERYLKKGLSVETTTRQDKLIRTQVNNTVSIMISIQFSRRYSWHVAAGHRPDGPRMLLPTNPVGCLQFFKNRERDANRSRRAALRHWVARHYRDHSDAGVVFVRDHLRGETEFRWTDLACEIYVSQYDLEKNEAFKQEADLWRSQRKHNAVKVRLKRRAQ